MGCAAIRPPELGRQRVTGDLGHTYNIDIRQTQGGRVMAEKPSLPALIGRKMLGIIILFSTIGLVSLQSRFYVIVNPPV